MSSNMLTLSENLSNLINQFLEYQVSPDITKEKNLIVIVKNEVLKIKGNLTEEDELFLSKMTKLLIENRFVWVSDFSELDFKSTQSRLSHFFQVCQLIRILSKNTSFHLKLIRHEDIIIRLEIMLMNINEIVSSNFYVFSKFIKLLDLVNDKNTKISEEDLLGLKTYVENILLEILTIIRRLIGVLDQGFNMDVDIGKKESKSDKIIDSYSIMLDFVKKVSKSKIIPNLVSLSFIKDKNCSKQLNSIFLILFNKEYKEVLYNNFSIYVNVSNLILGLKEKTNDSHLIEYISYLSENSVFRFEFNNQEGISVLIK